jgi:hypothetical protein
MKLPDFNEFIQARADGKFDHIKVYGSEGLPANPSHERVVAFARTTAAQTTMLILEQYHLWLAEQLTTPDQSRQ